MRIVRILLMFIISAALLNGCAIGDKKVMSTSIDIPNVEIYTILYVQGVDANGASSNETSKYITEDNEIKSFIEKVNKMEVVKPSKKEMTKKVKELNNQGNYIFVLSDSKHFDNNAYHMNFYKDGSIQFQRMDKKEMIYLSKEKHPELIRELKETFNINF